MEIKLTHPLLITKRALILIMMRTFIFLFCTSLFSLTPNHVLSQKARITIESDMKVSVDEVFDMITTQTKYAFIYHENLFKDFPKVELKKGIISLNRLFNKSLPKKQDLNIIVTKDNTILIRERNKNNNRLQTIITGTVTDAGGLPIAGVTVLVKGTITGTATDFDGGYSIKVSSTENVLVFSSLGFKTQEITVGNQSTINVVLNEQADVLDEVKLVSTGYQKISRERATGSFEKVSEEILEVKTAQNILSKLEGEVTGVLFDNDGNITVRGESTINAVNEPLIVVDGFPIQQSLSTINPNDVQSITVLKDAAAASIWGIRAANGVIVIVTRKGGRNQKIAVDYTSNFSITQKRDLNDLPITPTNSLLEFEKHRADNAWLLATSSFNSSPVGEAYKTFLALDSGALTQGEADAIISGLRGIDVRNEFANLFISNETWMQHNLSITGGGENNSFRASITYNENKNLESSTGNNRGDVIANLSNNITLLPKLSLDANINYVNTVSKSNGIRWGEVISLPQYQRIVDANGNYVTQPRTIDQSLKDGFASDGYPYSWDYNLKQELDNKNNRTVNTQLRLQTSLKYDITDNLNVQGLYQYEYGFSKTENLFNEDTYRVRDLVNRFTTLNGTSGALESAIPKGEILDLGDSNTESHTGRFQLNYDQSFNDGLHQINAIAGYEIRKTLFKSYQSTLYGFDSRSLAHANLNYKDEFSTSPSGGNSRIDDGVNIENDENRFISYYVNAAYTYDNKYTITGSTRLDDTNLFGADEEYKNIPLYSFGVKWNISNENFFKSKVVNNLTLRITNGSNGNVDNSTSPFVLLKLDNNFNSDIPFAGINSVKNPELRLERVFVNNIGLDFGLWNNRLSGSIEYYERKSQDLLSQVSFPSILGFNSALINAGEMENKGFEIGLNALAVNGKSFKYNTSINFSYNKNEVTKVEVPEETVVRFLFFSDPILNKPLRYLYSYRYNGLDSNGDPQFLNENNEVVNVEGQLANGDNASINNVEGLVFEGTTTPKYYGAWVNRFSYKNFFIRALTTFKFGHVFRNTDNFLDYSDTRLPFLTNVHADFDNRWRNPGDENSTNIPRLPDAPGDLDREGYRYYRSGDHLVDDASHIRLREVVLGYNLSSKVANKLGLNSLSLSVQGNNLALINFNKWNVDPENQLFGLRKTFTLSVNANF
ncbi:SusC/RagA family TonB-linked outer membrane protein [Flavivirga eckloniae]|uniref:SusC/RagA family TonB-linked outer membrane protein n=1 Tax=Flavivirga eckloniae TaxID=1803846 RepID=A0A2K9PUD3_9FLAO|nr:SusC/RagA family TonB-linked outer membrane protein [Flavivirga eckloniae]AUP80680.1 hypothetical protein C1H87_18960 [Flavivirga eckloniae]